jgi:hypothetical protein
MTIRRVIALLLMLLVIAVPSFAIFGVGDIVHDPISYFNALLMLAELVKNYEQLKAQLELQLQMAQTVPVDMWMHYLTQSAAWYGLDVPADPFTNLYPWLEAVNRAGDARSGYSAATIPLQSYGAAFSRLPVEEQTRIQSHYGSIQLTDGINVQAMETIGQLRNNAELVDQSISQLEADSLSLDPAMNTEIALLNKINAASVAQLRSTRDANRLSLSILEEQVADSKVRRDAHVSEVNAQIYVLEKGEAVRKGRTSTMGEALRSFRWK